jgi:HEPN domain-containing protein
MNTDDRTEKAEYIKKWFTKADHDLQTACNERHIDADEILTDTICFHCQQAVEKYLKSFLIWHDIDFKPVHDLVYLQQLCSKVDTDFKAVSLNRLTGFGVALRYPDDFYMPTLQEADSSVEIAQKIKVLVRGKIEPLFKV